MVDEADPLKMTLRTFERWVAAIAGGFTLVASGVLMSWGAINGKTVNSVGVGSMFAISLVLLVLAVAGRLPANVSVTDKGFVVGFAAGAAAGAEKATEKAKEQVVNAIKEDREDLMQNLTQANTRDDVGPVLDWMSQRIQAKLTTPRVADLLPDVTRLAEMARALE